MMTLNARVEAKLEEIAQTLLEAESFDRGIALTGGRSGVLLFLFLYSRYKVDQKYEDKAVVLLKESLQMINSGQTSMNFSSGVSGFAWVLEHLAEQDIIEPLDLLYPLDEKIGQLMVGYFNADNWDALHGGIGVSLYLFKRVSNPKVKAQLEEAIQILHSKAIETEDTMKWITYNSYMKTYCYNFGLAHGMPSILYFLTKCIEHGIEKELSQTMLKKCTAYLLKYKVEDDKHPNCFPSSVEKSGEVNTYSRLAWCYGDPGVVLALIKANEVLQGLDGTIKATIESIIKRQEIDVTGVADAGICHGSAGLLHILQYLNSIGYQDIISDELVDQWVEETLNWSQFQDGLAGYRVNEGVDENKKPLYKSVSYGMLDGIAGIGLCFLSYLNKNNKWNAALFMS